jgi:ABC-type sugar transport system ATPase subunit
MAEEALAAVGLSNISPSAATSTLTPGLRQMLAMSRTQVNPHNILLLDETTASTTEEHFQDVLALVEKERSEGTSIIFVSHRMQEVFSMSDRIAVLRGGRLIGVRNTRETDHDEILTMMVGESVAKLDASKSGPGEEVAPMVKVRGLASGSAKNIDFDVRPGEIVGLYGLVGSGRSSIARSISGQQDRDAGTVEINGRFVHPKTPRHALAAKIAYASEDRRKEGFIPAFSNGHNITLTTLERYAKFGVLNLKYEARRVDELIAKFQIRGTGTSFTANLSGGNQQKVCLAKWLETEPDLILLDEPTKGIDVGARMSIYQTIRTLADLGKAVVVISSEAEEIMMLCNRTLIIRDGAIVDRMTSNDNTIDDVIRASLGGKEL